MVGIFILSISAGSKGIILEKTNHFNIH